MDTKTCRDCGLTFPLELFPIMTRHSQYKTQRVPGPRRYPRCRSCNRAFKAAARRNQRERQTPEEREAYLSRRRVIEKRRSRAPRNQRVLDRGRTHSIELAERKAHKINDEIDFSVEPAEPGFLLENVYRTHYVMFAGQRVLVDNVETERFIAGRVPSHEHGRFFKPHIKAEMILAVLALYHYERYSDYKIAKRLNVDESLVWKWRKVVLGLPAHADGARSYAERNLW